MEEMYSDLEIRILEKRERGYPVEVTFEEQVFHSGYLTLEAASWRFDDPPKKAKEAGEELFEMLFADRNLREAWASAAGRTPHRRVRLRIDHTAPELQTLPWELLRDVTVGEESSALAADRNTPFSRYSPVARRPRELLNKPPVKMLVAIANPDDLESEPYRLPALDVDIEERILREAVAGLEGTQVEVTFLAPPVTLSALSAELGKDYNILHYVGHGAYSTETDQAMLLMANEQNITVAVEDSDFAEMLGLQGKTLRLVFLATCQSAMGSAEVPFRGLASRIVASGVPAVLAMQDRVAVQMARELAKVFYGHLLTHGQVDMAANEARAAVIARGLADSGGIATLISCLPDNQILKFADRPDEEISQLFKIAAMPRAAASGSVEGLATSLTLQENREMQAGVDQGLALFGEAQVGAKASELFQAGELKVSRVELLLTKATLLETEAEQMLRAHVEGQLPRILSQVTAGQANWEAWRPGIDTPFKAKMRSALEVALQASLPQVFGAAFNQLGMAQLDRLNAYIADRLLAGYDLSSYEAKINEAYALVEEAKELEPENVEVDLHVARLTLALHPDDPSQSQRLLYRLVHRLEDPQDDQARLYLGHTLVLLATAQQPENLNQLRQARELFVAAGHEELTEQADRQLVLSLVRRAKALCVKAEQDLANHIQLKVQEFLQGMFSWQNVPAPPPPGSYEAGLTTKCREIARRAIPQTFWTNQLRMGAAQQEAALSALVSFILADLNVDAFQTRFADALVYLEEATEMAPADPAVMLAKAEVLVWHTPADMGDEQALLQQVRSRLRDTQDETEKALLAQAVFALATLDSPPDEALVREAKVLFAGLGWHAQVAACDALLTPPFIPVGQWQIRVGDAFGSMMQVVLQPDGTCMGTQQSGPYGGVAQFAGYWGYDPKTRTLQFQVMVNRVQPYQLGIQILGEQGGGYVGRGSDGFSYQLMRFG